MQQAKGFGGRSFHGGRGLWRIHLQVQVFHARLENEPTEHGNREKDHEKQKGQPMERASGVKPFADELGESDPCAPLLEEKVTFDNDLGRSSRMSSGMVEQGQHLVREKGGAGEKGKKADGSKPDCGIYHTDKTQKSNHTASVEIFTSVPRFLSGGNFRLR
jgi:hypothetical protein